MNLTQEQIEAEIQIGIKLHEMESLEKWFLEYDNQVKQYSRCQRLGLEFDKDINELDNQAKVNAERIAEIRGLLNISK